MAVTRQRGGGQRKDTGCGKGNYSFHLMFLSVKDEPSAKS